MTESNHHQYVERRAWSIMIGAFIAFCASMAGLIYAGHWFIFESEVLQETSATLISGTVSYSAGGADPVIIVEGVSSLAEGTRIDTDTGSQAAVSFYAADQTTALGSMQLYGGSTIVLNVFRSPRFEASPNPHHMTVTMQRGRARVNLAVDVLRPISITLTTPHGDVLLERSGSYSIEVTDQATEVVVRDGVATASAGGQSINLAPGERTVLDSTNALEVKTGERNLIVNGDFSGPLAPADWNVSQERKEATDVEGKIEVTVETGRNAIHFFRPGRDWGRVKIEQKINRDVRDYASLRLHLALKIVRQNVLVCGTYGSECPVMIDIEYTDQVGNRKHWLQGFYYLGDTSNSVPVLCVTCSSEPKQNHIQVQQNTWYAYDSADLIALLNKPTIINVITVYAEGHTVESFVSEVELQAGD
jgi:hypothetical protein